MSMKIHEFERLLCELCGSSLSVDEGLKYGDANAQISGIVNCWIFNEEVAALAKHEGCNLILAHEALYVPYGALEGAPFGDDCQRFLAWPANRLRTQALVKNDLHFVRFHGHADQVCVFDCFAAQLGLSQVHARGPFGYDAVFRHEERTVGAWCDIVKGATGMRNLRVSIGDPERRVTKIGLAWGGMGLALNAFYPMKLIELGAELIIAGETDNYGFRISREAGADVIECSHEVSENAGIARLGDILREKLETVRIVDFCNPCIWYWA